MNEKIRDVSDSIRKKLIPCFDDLYSVSVSLIHKASGALKVLDIGAGAGLLTSFLPS